MNHPIKTAAFAVLAVFSLGIAASAEITHATDFKALEKDLAAVAPILAKDEVRYEDVATLEEKLDDHIQAIYLDINTRLPDGLGHLTPEWQAYITKLGSTMEPYEPAMIEAAFRTLGIQFRPGTGQVRRIGSPLHRLLNFAKPDAEIEAGLRRALEEFPRAKWEIYRQLLELRLLKESDIEDMVAMGEGIEDPKDKVRWAEEVAFYGSDAGLDLFEELLRVPFDPKGAVNERGEPELNESYLSYGPAWKGILRLREKAVRLRPLLEAREKEIRDFFLSQFGEEESHRFLIGFTIFKMALNGESAVPRESARNSSGLLYLPGEIPGNAGERKTGKNPDSSSEPGRRDLRSKSVGEPSRSSPGGGFPSWLLVAGLAMIISGAVIVVRRMKRK